MADSPRSTVTRDFVIADRGRKLVRLLRRGADGKLAQVWTTDPGAVTLPQIVCRWGRDVLVSDSRKCRILKVDAGSGEVTVVAGSGLTGSRDGPLQAATFAGPWGLCAGGDGAIYVSEYFGCRIRKISVESNEVTTVAGSRGGYADGGSGTFAGPRGMCFDASSNSLVVADSGNHVVRRVDLVSGRVTTLAGSGLRGNADGPADLATFNEPTSVALDDLDGTVYVADLQNHRIRAIRHDGTVSTLCGTGDQTVASSSHSSSSANPNPTFNFPSALVVDPNDRALYVSDVQVLRHVSLKGRRIPASDDETKEKEPLTTCYKTTTTTTTDPRDEDAAPAVDECIWCSSRSASADSHSAFHVEYDTLRAVAYRDETSSSPPSQPRPPLRSNAHDR